MALDLAALLHRRLLLIPRACDPREVAAAAGGVANGLAAVAAALRMRVAETCVLGGQLGHLFAQVYVMSVILIGHLSP